MEGESSVFHETEVTTMTSARMMIAVTVAVATLVPTTGCLRRKETITVNPDQSVRIDIEYQDDTPNFGAPDAMPGKEAGWDAETVAEKKDNGDMEYRLVASRTFAPGTPLPRNYVAPRDPDADLYLDFPTELSVENGPDGTLYTLRRVYTARPWAYVQYWEDRVMEGDVKKLLDKPENELTAEEKEKILRALASVEVLRRLELSHTALQRAEIRMHPEGWLEARQALLDRITELDFTPILETQKQLEAAPADSPEKDALEKRLQSMLKELSDASLNAYEEQLKGSLEAAANAAYEKSLQRVTKQYEITKATSGHQFEIRVKMPGRVLGHNADKVEEDGTVVWEFDGKAFHDRDHELLVVSRLQPPSADSSR
jgi:hypothetical protein